MKLMLIDTDIKFLAIFCSHWLSTSPCHSSSFCSCDWPEFSQPFPTADTFLPPSYFCICLNQAVFLRMEAVGFSKPSELTFTTWCENLINDSH